MNSPLRFYKVRPMRKFNIVILFSLMVHSLHAQQHFIDSLKAIINQDRHDIGHVNALAWLGNNVSDSADAVHFAKQGLTLAQKINYKEGEADCNLVLSGLYGARGYSSEAIQYGLNALDRYRVLKDNVGMASSHLGLQGSYRDAEDFTNALLHEFEGLGIAQANNLKGVFFFENHYLTPLFLAEIAQTYILKDQPDSAQIYAQKAIEENELFDGTSWEFPIYLLATIQQMRGDYHSSLESYRAAVRLAKLQPDNAHDTLQIYSGISTLLKKMGHSDSALYYAQIVNASWKPGISEKKNLLEAVNNLFEIYKLKGEKDSALKYLELNFHLRETFYNTQKSKQIQEATFSAQLKQQQIVTDQAKYRNRLQFFMFAAGILALLVISALLIRNNRHNKNAKLKIEKAYTELKATQAQLIQSEKMASLGELTAGIAHEIQNPLNFVNNFSEVNNELIEELKTCLSGRQVENEKLKIGDGEVNDLLNDLYQNNEKISMHGKRADSIVKGMLQHSRTSSGQKKLTDINELVDEYLRLAYHGLRAKDKSFNAKFETNFDNSIGKINIIPQDIGRVILNLINNAFYAANERRVMEGQGYEPTVIISTTNQNGKVEIKVKDNGNGIPRNILEKIFQPFFTTKPTGQGTGLGLSLAYDIIKAHGGELKVNTKEGEESEFIIQLPA